MRPILNILLILSILVLVFSCKQADDDEDDNTDYPCDISIMDHITFSVEMPVTYNVEGYGQYAIQAIRYHTDSGEIVVEYPPLPWSATVVLKNQRNIRLAITSIIENGQIKIGYYGKIGLIEYVGFDECSWYNQIK